MDESTMEQAADSRAQPSGAEPASTALYRSCLAAMPTVREVPIQLPNLLVANLEKLATAVTDPAAANSGAVSHVEAVTVIFTDHDSLNSALVRAEDAWVALADRLDLDDEHTGELKTASLPSSAPAVPMSVVAARLHTPIHRGQVEKD